MLARICFVIAVVLLALIAFGCSDSTSSASGGCPDAVSWNDAADHVGDEITVQGPVVGTRYASDSNGEPTFLNLGEDYPNEDRMTVVIWGDDRAEFGSPEDEYDGKDICVSGVVDTYEGIPQIAIDSTDDISVT